MPYYDKTEYRLLGFRKSDVKDKMYYALLQNNYTNLQSQHEVNTISTVTRIYKCSNLYKTTIF